MSQKLSAHDSVEKSAIHKISVRLVPFVALMFFINFLDRTAIGYAGPHGMEQDLSINAAQFGLASGIFFIGYIILEIPSNLALHKFGARRWLARIMVSWGIVATLFTWIQSVTHLYILRVLLGVAEAGFFPGAILFLSLWVPSRYRSRILMLFYLAQPLTTMIGAPLASWLISHHGALGLEGWRFMFLMVGLPAVIVGVIAYFYLKDSPEDAKWLTPDEQNWLRNELDKEAVSTTSSNKSDNNVKAALTSGRVWVLSLIYFGFIYGLYALGFFLPSIIKGFGQQFDMEISLINQGLITAIPYACAAIAMYLWSNDVGRRGLKSWHIAGPAAVGGICIPIALFVDSPILSIIIISITAMSIFAVLPNFWTLPTQFLTGAPAAAGVALINTLGNVAGFSAGYITGAVHDLTDGYIIPMFIVGGFMILSAVMMVLLARSGKVKVADQNKTGV